MDETKLCLICKKHLHGRTDKKFCTDYCRNTFNNHLNSDGNKLIRNINHSLRKNRRILESLLQPHPLIFKTSRQFLYNKGFSFTYFTHMVTNKNGCVYRFCYEYGYLILEGGDKVIVRKKGNPE